MSTESEQTYLQRKHTDTQQAHEKVLNIVSHQRNAKQIHKETRVHTHQGDCNQTQPTNQKVTGPREDAGKSVPRASLMRTQTGTSILETVWQPHKDVKRHLMV